MPRERSGAPRYRPKEGRWVEIGDPLFYATVNQSDLVDHGQALFSAAYWYDHRPVDKDKIVVSEAPMDVTLQSGEPRQDFAEGFAGCVLSQERFRKGLDQGYVFMQRCHQVIKRWIEPDPPKFLDKWMVAQLGAGHGSILLRSQKGGGWVSKWEEPAG